jgi:hypothetical protein
MLVKLKGKGKYLSVVSSSALSSLPGAVHVGVHFGVGVMVCVGAVYLKHEKTTLVNKNKNKKYLVLKTRTCLDRLFVCHCHDSVMLTALVLAVITSSLVVIVIVGCCGGSLVAVGGHGVRVVLKKSITRQI